MPFCLDAGDPFEVAIRGDSVAAWCSAHLLSAAGLNPVLDRTPRQRVPAIMISDAAVAMIRDVFGKPGLFAKAPRITRRVVQWGRNSNPAAFDHAAIVVSELELLNELEEDLTPAAGPRGGGRTLTSLASRPLTGGSLRTLLRFANRPGCSSRVEGRALLGRLLDRIHGGWMAFLDPEFGRFGMASFRRMRRNDSLAEHFN